MKLFCNLGGLCKAKSCVKIWLMCFSVEIMAYRLSTFSHTILFWSVLFSTWNSEDSFCCCHNNRQKSYHPGQNSPTFMLRRPLSEQALALPNMIPDFLAIPIVILSGMTGVLLLDSTPLQGWKSLSHSGRDQTPSECQPRTLGKVRGWLMQIWLQIPWWFFQNVIHLDFR